MEVGPDQSYQYYYTESIRGQALHRIPLKVIKAMEENIMARQIPANHSSYVTCTYTSAGYTIHRSDAHQLGCENAGITYRIEQPLPSPSPSKLCVSFPLCEREASRVWKCRQNKSCNSLTFRNLSLRICGCVCSMCNMYTKFDKNELKK